MGNNGGRRVWAKWGKGARRGINPAGGGGGGGLVVDVCGSGNFVFEGRSEEIVWVVGTADETRRSREDADRFRKWRWRGEVIRGGEVHAREAASEIHGNEGEHDRPGGFFCG